MIPGDEGDVLAIRVPAWLHDKIGAIGKLPWEFSAIRINDRQPIDMFVTVHIDYPAPVRRDGRRGIAAKLRRNRAGSAAGQRLTIDASVGNKKHLAITERKGAAAIANTSGYI